MAKEKLEEKMRLEEESQAAAVRAPRPNTSPQLTSLIVPDATSKGIASSPPNHLDPALGPFCWARSQPPPSPYYPV